ncbi:MAG: dihydroorotase [Candidatus Cloacimonadota bacterium]|nr:MAG: dihydroorotase [Candidatus Cloacimonadota bacterium]
MTILLKNGTVFQNDKFVKKDILICDSKIKETGENLDAEADKVIDLTGKHVFPGFVDLHAHLRDPGQTHKEDIVSGTKAAAKGGFTTICCMPNTEPIIDNIATVEYVKRKAADLGFCKVKIIGAMTKKSAGKEIAEISYMKDGGIVAVSDDGGCVQESKLMLNAMKYTSSFDLPVIIHAEDYSLAGKGQINSGRMSTKLGLGGIPALAEEIIISRDIMLAKSSKCHLHVAHISTKGAIELVRKAKAEGIKVTAEVTPHHLLLNEEACENFDTNCKVKPPLRDESDRLACIEALKDGTIDFIATDHAPHADYEKTREFNLAPFGINVFETAFSSLYTHLVKQGVLTLEELVKALAQSPAEFLKLNTGKIEAGFDADLAIADLESTYMLNPEEMFSKSKNTPFLHQKFTGEIVMTFCDGKIRWEK